MARQTRWAARVPPRSVRSLRVLDDRIGASMSAADAIRTAIAALESERRAVERERDHAADMAMRYRQAVAYLERALACYRGENHG